VNLPSAAIIERSASAARQIAALKSATSSNLPYFLVGTLLIAVVFIPPLWAMWWQPLQRRRRNVGSP
jgi:hypothetical protein